MSEQPVPGTRSTHAERKRAASPSPIWPCTRWGFPCLVACASSGGLLLHLFTLARPIAQPGGLFSVALSVGTPRGVAARVYRSRTSLRYVASRPVVFGLSSPAPLAPDRSDSPPFQNRGEDTRSQAAQQAANWETRSGRNSASTAAARESLALELPRPGRTHAARGNLLRHRHVHVTGVIENASAVGADDEFLGSPT